MASAAIPGADARPASAQAVAAATGGAHPFSGLSLFFAGFTLALANFVVVLDMTIANVSIPHIAGSLGVTPATGTYVVTSYSVAEAICVPLTGWLVNRFGAVRLFIAALGGFGLFSILCGLSHSLGFLVAFRLGQGFSGGPLMPLSMMLLLKVFPPERQGQATAMWAMTTVTGPIVGPILGGWISDGLTWQWIFFIIIPIVAACLFGAFTLLRRIDTPTQKDPIDIVGLLLLVIWVGALQLMLDLGREDDWFSSSFICTCAVVAVVGFAAFVIWELTDAHPIVDLKILRHRGFAMTTIALSATFGTFFASIVVIPQWLQGSLGYTATQAGYVTCMHGVSAILISPVVARLMQKYDPRLLASGGIMWIAMTSLLRTQWSTDSTFTQLAMAQLIQGFAMPFFFIPLSSLSLSAVLPAETASAAGVINFARTLAGAMAAAITTTVWSNMAVADHDKLTSTLNAPDAVLGKMGAMGMDPLQARTALDGMVTLQAASIATEHLFAISAVVFAMAAMIVWLVPKPKGPVAMQMGH